LAGDLVVAAGAAVFDLLIRTDTLFLLQLVECGVERTLLKIEDAFGAFLDALGDRVAVIGVKLESFKNECG
jgi:archaellum biogenesis protein FlaJ (TadC family)